MKLRKLIFLSILISIAIVLSILESYISPFIYPGMPWIKIGLANIITLVVLYAYTSKDAVIVLMIRIFLVSLIHSGLFTIYSLTSFGGGLLAILAMLLMKRLKIFSMVSVSVAGSIFHIVGQILALILLSSITEFAYMIPYMLLTAIPAGVFTGLVAKKMVDVFENQLLHPLHEE
jgi:heptaprenyl diphosphate synthase